MEVTVGLTGDISVAEIEDLLSKFLPDKKVKIINGSEILSELYTKDEEIERLRNLLAYRDEDMEEMGQSLAKSMQTIQSFHKQQKELFDEFLLLRNKYDEVKDSLVETLWEHCAKYHPALKELPFLENDSFVETENRVGNYNVGKKLGEGQFGTVWTCVRDGNETESAVKISQKERITSFSALKRVSNEIEILRRLNSEYIISIKDVIQTKTNLYIITEKGGPDLFDFFESHPEGVPEAWAKEIIANLVKGVGHCHMNGVCHLDLKPENVLVIFDYENSRCEDLKLCDFGLSSRFLPRCSLQDFCGSPGFFAPEMLINGSYYGDKADVWSVGCIILELMLGHVKFCEYWMTAYDYDIIQDQDRFKTEITNVTKNLPSILHFSTEMNDLLTRFLRLRPSERSSMSAISQHAWFEGKISPELFIRTHSISSQKISVDVSSPSKDSSYPSPRLNSAPTALGLRNSIGGTSTAGNTGRVAASVRNVRNELSVRQRKRIENYNAREDVTKESIGNVRLPPLEPMTPNIGKATLILEHGEKLVKVVDTIHEKSERSVSISDRSHNNNTDSSNRSSAHKSPRVKSSPRTLAPMISIASTSIEEVDESIEDKESRSNKYNGR